jgi:hypothetical protein
MKDTDAIDQERQRRGEALAAEMREAMEPRTAEETADAFVAGMPEPPPPRAISCIVDELIDASVRLEMAHRPQSIQIGSHRVERLENELSAALAERDGLMRKALEALEYCIEDSAELLNERTVQWGEWRHERQAAMAATLEKHRAVAERLRRVLNGA